jgi:putative ABC transport system permease protein
MSIIKLEGVSKFYKSEETVSVGMKRINLEFDLGEFVAVTGESGSGKSTLLNVISGLDNYEEGELYLFGEETSHYTIQDWERYRGTNIGFVFQNYNIIDSYTVLQNVLLALEVQGYDPKKRKARALELIEKVGLLSHKNHKASKLSGGQKQRTVIARALAKDCPIIVADEPTGNLDSQSGAQVMQLLHDISQNKLVVVVTHDYNQVEAYATRKIKMHDGEVVEDKSVKTPQSVDNFESPKAKKMGGILLTRFALRNLFSMPKRMIFILMMQLVVMTAFVFVFTFRISLINRVEQTQSQRFPNVTETRVLVERRDGEEFTQQELSAFDSYRFVNHVYEKGLNFYNSSRLYTFKNINDQCQSGINCSYNSTYYMPIRGTDAAANLKSSLIEGSVPIAKNEIIYASPHTQIQIGDTISISYSQYVYNATPDSFLETFTVVGLDRSRSNIIYFSDAYLNDDNLERFSIDTIAITDIQNSLQNLRIAYGTNPFGEQILLNNTIPGRRINLGTRDLISMGTMNLTIFGYIYTDKSYAEISYVVNNVELFVAFEEEDRWNGYFSQAIYDEILDQVMTDYRHIYTIDHRPVVSLSVSGLHNGRKVINTLDSDTYRVIYPANIKDPSAAIQVFMIGLLTGVLMVLVGLLLYTIVHAVSKNMMKTRKKDFAIFRSIGTSKQTLARLVVVEQVITAALSSALTLILLFSLQLEIPAIYRIIQFMDFSDYIVLITLFLLFGAWLGLRFNKKVFSQSIIESIVTSRED